MGKFGKIETLSKGDTEIQVAPEMGLSLVRFVYRGADILDMSTEEDFTKLRKGLGPLILPHFNQFASVPEVETARFPHVEELKKRGVKHPFQHGVGRYVPWEWSADTFRVTGTLSSGQTHEGVRLYDLAGYAFDATVTYEVLDNGLRLGFAISGDEPVALGEHFYLATLDDSRATVDLPDCFEGGPRRIELAEPIDSVFPVKADTQPQMAECTVTTPGHEVVVRFPVASASDEHFESVVVFSPQGASFVCVEPVSYPVGEENTKKRFSASIELLVSS